MLGYRGGVTGERHALLQVHTGLIALALLLPR